MKTKTCVMNCKKLYTLFLCFSILSFPLLAQEKYSKVKIQLTSPAIKKFAFENLNLDHFTYEGNAMLVVLNSEELNRLRQSHYAFEVIVDDVVQHSLDVNRNIIPGITNRAAMQGDGSQKIANIIQTPAGFGTGGSLRLGAAVGNPGYFTYAEMTTIMQNLETANPTLVKRFSIGNSAAGTPIYGVKISDNVTVDENEPEVLFTGLQHAREAIAGTSMIFFMQYLVANYGNTNHVIKDLVDNREIFIIPCMNPDGYAFNYGGSSASYPTTGGGLWRKNRRNTGGGAANIGVDLNRNYSIDWSNCSGASASCGSNLQTDDTYYGPSAFSEPETQALRDFVYTRHFVNAIDQHCYGPYYSLPYGRPTLHPALNHIDSSYYKYIPALMGLYNGYRAGNSLETVQYEVAGGIKDWLLLGDIGTGTGPKGKIYGMTGEAGGGNFWAPVSEIIQLCKENCFQNLQLAYAAGDYYDMQDKDDIAVTSLTGTLHCLVRRVGQGNSPVTISLIPIQNIVSVGSPVTTTLANYFDTSTATFSYTLSGSILSGQRIKFAWKVESGGIATYDTVTKYYNPITLLSDDMEGSFATNWTATISPSGPAGWAFTTLAAFGGTHSMTESPGGNYTTSSTRTVTYKNTLNLIDATEAYLSFWVKHRAENFRDKLQVQVSTNGSTWVPVSGTTTVTEDNTTNGGTLGGQPALTGIREEWTRELFDLSAFKGNTTVSLRFQFTSDNDASGFAFELDDGFYLDNIKVIKSTVITPVAVKFVNFYGKLLTDKSVQLDWEAFTDDQHAYFEVEKSTDRNTNFISIVRISNGVSPNYRSFDYFPAAGNNYYRIKQVNKDGTISYSKTIDIVYAPGLLSIIAYPNPTKDNLFVKLINYSTNDNLTFTITDVAGRKLYEQNTVISAGTSEIKLNIKNLPPNIYVLKVANGETEIINIQKFIKQ